MTVGLIRTGNAAALGTGTTKTKISPDAGLFLPGSGRVLLGIKPTMAVGTVTINQTVTAKLEVESSDVHNMTPYEVLFAPIGATGNIAAAAQAPTFTGVEYWEINAPLTGGEAIHVYATALVANTAQPQAMAFAVVSNDIRDMMGKARVHAKMGTLTASGTVADTDVAGTKYNLSGGHEIVELFGLFHPKTLAASDYFIGEIKFVSSEFDNSIPQTLPLYPQTYGLATSSYLIPGVSRQKVRVPIGSGQVNILDYLNFGGVVATEGSFVSGVEYI